MIKKRLKVEKKATKTIINSDRGTSTLLNVLVFYKTDWTIKREGV